MSTINDIENITKEIFIRDELIRNCEDIEAFLRHDHAFNAQLMINKIRTIRVAFQFDLESMRKKLSEINNSVEVVR